MPISKLARDFDVEAWLAEDLARYTDKNWQDYDEVTGVKNCTEDERARSIRNIVEDSNKNHACSSCPFEPICTDSIHDKRDAFTKVTGCSKHPDQSKYEGHSTTVIITDTTGCAYTSRGEGAWNWASIRSNTGTNVGQTQIVWGYYESGASNFIYRGMLYFNTVTIPSVATISATTLQLYVTHPSSTGTDTGNVVYGGATVPHLPAQNSDYDIANWGATVYGTVSASSLPTNAYYSWTLSDNTFVNKAGVTRGGVRWGNDISNTDPGAGSTTRGNNAHGSTGASPPMISITYSVDYWYYVDGTATWNAWNEGWAVGAGR